MTPMRAFFSKIPIDNVRLTNVCNEAIEIFLPLSIHGQPIVLYKSPSLLSIVFEEDPHCSRVVLRLCSVMWVHDR